MSDARPRKWEIWHVRFSFAEGKGYKYRPSIVIGRDGEENVVLMVTAATNKLHMENDYLLRDWESEGLVKPSIARVDRVIEVPSSFFGTAGKIGKLTERDRREVAEALERAIPEAPQWR